jgi:hypothetical protein
MSEQRAPRRRRGRRRKPGGQAGGLGRQAPPLDDPRPITPAKDPAALVRSLGSAPLQGHGALVDYYLAEVVQQAAKIAKALAFSAGVLHEHDDE